MKMSRLWIPALLLGLVLLFDPATVQAKQYVLQNSTQWTIYVALVVPTGRSWRVRGWTRIEPYSYKRVTYGEAGGDYFAVYAERSGGGYYWTGRGNAPTVAIHNSSMNHDVSARAYGKSKYVKVRMVRGYSYRFTT